MNTLEDLKPGMRMPGKVTNVTRFGAFVDVGVHQDGLVHISQLADRFVRDPAEVVKVGQTVSVTVMEVDLERKRIALSMRESPDKARPAREGSKGAGGAQAGPRKGPARKKKDPPRKQEEKLDPNNPFVKALKGENWRTK